MDSQINSVKPMVLITGAAGGLGKALIRQFLAHGWNVIATDNRELALAEFIHEGSVQVINMDVTSEESVKTVFEKLNLQQITLDLIINNAGIDCYFPLSEAPARDFINVFDINVFGAYRVNQTFLPILRKPGAKIIHIGSESLHLKVPFMPYPLSKNLLESYSAVLRQELRFHRISVVAVRPGAIQTPLLEGVSRLQAGHHQWKLKEPFINFANLASKMVGRTVSPDKVAAFVFRKSVLKNPRAVYRINNKIKLRLAALTPHSILEYAIKILLSQGNKNQN